MDTITKYKGVNAIYSAVNILTSSALRDVVEKKKTLVVPQFQILRNIKKQRLYTLNTSKTIQFTSRKREILPNTPTLNSVPYGYRQDAAEEEITLDVPEVEPLVSQQEEMEVGEEEEAQESDLSFIVSDEEEEEEMQPRRVESSSEEEESQEPRRRQLNIESEGEESVLVEEMGVEAEDTAKYFNDYKDMELEMEVEEMGVEAEDTSKYFNDYKDMELEMELEGEGELEAQWSDEE